MKKLNTVSENKISMKALQGLGIAIILDHPIVM